MEDFKKDPIPNVHDSRNKKMKGNQIHIWREYTYMTHPTWARQRILIKKLIYIDFIRPRGPSKLILHQNIYTLSDNKTIKDGDIAP